HAFQSPLRLVASATPLAATFHADDSRPAYRCRGTRCFPSHTLHRTSRAAYLAHSCCCLLASGLARPDLEAPADFGKHAKRLQLRRRTRGNLYFCRSLYGFARVT